MTTYATERATLTIRRRTLGVVLAAAIALLALSAGCAISPEALDAIDRAGRVLAGPEVAGAAATIATAAGNPAAGAGIGALLLLFGNVLQGAAHLFRARREQKTLDTLIPAVEAHGSPELKREIAKRSLVTGTAKHVQRAVKART